MAGYTRQSAAQITTSATIEAAHHNAEFNAIESAFSGTTGHNHAGGTGQGPQLSLTAAVTGTLPVANGGTGGATASAARTALGLAIGTDVQAYDAQLGQIAALTPTDGNFIVGDGAAFVLESGATARTSLGLDTMATQAASSVAITGGTIAGITDLAVADGGTGASTAADARTNLGLVIGTNVQAYDAQLADVAGLAVTDGGFIVGDGANFVLETGATARASLGLGTMATQNAASVTVTGGTIDGVVITNSTIGGGGVTAVASGGTGATTAADARTNLGLVIGTDVQAYDADLGALAGLTSAADKVPYFTGAGTAGVADFTSFGRTLVANANAADTRTDLGLGTAALAGSASDTSAGIVELATNAEVQTGTDTARAVTPAGLTAKEASAAQFQNNTADRILTTDIVWSAADEVVLTDAATIAVDMNSFINARVTLAGNRTLGQPTNAKVGQAGHIRITQDATGSRTLAYHSDWKFTNGIDPTLSTAAGTVDILFYKVIASGFIYASLNKAVA